MPHMQRNIVKRGMLACLFSVWACSENAISEGAGGVIQDAVPPTVNVTLGNPSIINQALQFTVSGGDDISLRTVGWSVTGAVTKDTLITFTSTTPSFSEAFAVSQGFASGTYTIIATATDGAGNEAVPDTVIGTVSLPTVIFVQPDPVGPLFAARIGDSARVQVQLNDGEGLSKVTIDGVALRGSTILGTDTVVQRFDPKVIDNLNGVTDTLVIRDVLSTPGDVTPESVTLRAIVQDIEGNLDTATIVIAVVAGPKLTITLPADSAQVAPGFNVSVAVLGEGALVASLGFLTIGNVTATDTTFYPIGSQPDTVLAPFTLAIPATAVPGFFTLYPIGQDSAGNLGTGTPITVEVVSTATLSDTVPPLILDTVELRVEVDDEIIVSGQDLGGVTRLGYVVTDLALTVVSGDSVDFGGTNTNEIVTFGMRLDTVVSVFPTQLIVTTFGIDGAGNRGGNSFDGVTAIPPVGQADTITVVAGITIPLPNGGTVADAIYSRNLNEVYLANPDLDQVEIFDIATTAFQAPIPVGSRPWGIGLWPVDTTFGTHQDTIVVANSGGTNLSIVDVRTGVRVETRRHALPNFIIHRVKTDPTEASGDTRLRLIIEEHDFSDRPQFLGMVCRPTTASTNCAQDSILAVYSTTPTIDQGATFTLRGSMRMENLTACKTFDPVPTGERCAGGTGVPESHFFWESAARNPGAGSDTLQIILHRARQTTTVLSAASAITVNFANLGFRDTTFVRNSGNFTRVLIGEGGNVGDDLFARVVVYDAQRGTTTTTDTLVVLGDTLIGSSIIDLGLSPGVEVRDFISNTAIPVRSIGVNFNGLTNLVRADSIYVLNKFLRLTGIIEASGSNPGMDLNFNHSFDASDGGTPKYGGPLDPDDRLLFAARDDANIGVYDTWNFGLVTTVPIRDPVIGPLRVAKITATGEQLLIGVTSSGVVTVKLPSITNIFLSPATGWRPPRR